MTIRTNFMRKVASGDKSMRVLRNLIAMKKQAAVTQPGNTASQDDMLNQLLVDIGAQAAPEQKDPNDPNTPANDEAGMKMYLDLLEGNKQRRIADAERSGKITGGVVGGLGGAFGGGAFGAGVGAGIGARRAWVANTLQNANNLYALDNFFGPGTQAANTGNVRFHIPGQAQSTNLISRPQAQSLQNTARAARRTAAWGGAGKGAAWGGVGGGVLGGFGGAVTGAAIGGRLKRDTMERALENGTALV